MATWDDVRRLALALPEVSQDRDAPASWSVRTRTFAWERPLRKGDLAALGAAAPSGPVLALRVADLEAKEALLAENPEVCFTTPHFHSYAAVLVRLELIGAEELAELLDEAWTSRAPKVLVRQRRQR